MDTKITIGNQITEFRSRWGHSCTHFILNDEGEEIGYCEQKSFPGGFNAFYFSIYGTTYGTHTPCHQTYEEAFQFALKELQKCTNYRIEAK